MTPTPPPDTAHETTDELREIARLLADLYIETCSVAGRAEGQVQSDAQEVRDEVARIHSRLTSVLDEVADPVESTEYRVTGTSNMRRPIESAENRDCALAERIAQEWRDGGWTDVRVESRTVRTWTSGWSPVPDDTQEK